MKSAAYAAQKKIAGRVSVTDDQIRGLLGALVAAPGHRLVPAQAAAALAVSPVMLRGAVLHVQRLLNVEGYPVLRVDADGARSSWTRRCCVSSSGSGRERPASPPGAGVR